MMKELEFEFDDEIFGESTCKESRVEEAYKPKQCDPEWFMQCGPNSDQTEMLNIAKYQGDLLFRKQNYRDAFVKYQESRQYLPPNNTVLDRELVESMAICLLKLEKCDDAVTLLKEAMEEDNQQNDSSLCYLLSRIYRSMGNIQGEIETLQRCATLHSWNSHFWYSLALAYERAPASYFQSQDRNIKESDKSCLLCQDLTENNCKEKCERHSCETELSAKSVNASNNTMQDPIPTKHFHDSDELEMTQCFSCLAVRNREDVHHFPSDCQSLQCRGVHEHSHTIWCSNRKCLESFKEDSNSCLVSSNRKCLPEHYGCGQDKSKWRKHVLAFGALVKSRFFLEKAIEASSSFARDKSETLLREVNAKIATHTDCGCAQQIDKVYELLYSSVIASDQAASDQEQTDIKKKECNKEETSVTNVTNSFDFEQKWFGDLLSYMDGK